MNDYNKEWCDERHDFIEKEFSKMWSKIKTLEGRLWFIVILLFMNLGGIIVSILTKG